MTDDDRARIESEYGCTVPNGLTITVIDQGKTADGEISRQEIADRGYRMHRRHEVFRRANAIRDMRPLVREGLTIKQIAERMDTNTAAVQELLKLAGIKTVRAVVKNLTPECEKS